MDKTVTLPELDDTAGPNGIIGVELPTDERPPEPFENRDREGMVSRRLPPVQSVLHGFRIELCRVRRLFFQNLSAHRSLLFLPLGAGLIGLRGVCAARGRPISPETVHWIVPRSGTWRRLSFSTRLSPSAGGSLAGPCGRGGRVLGRCWTPSRTRKTVSTPSGPRASSTRERLESPGSWGSSTAPPATRR